MRCRSLALLLPLVLLTAGCAQARETASTVSDCAGLASDVARSGLSGVPTRTEAEQAVQRLDDRVGSLDSPAVRDAATELRDRLRDLQEAARSADPAAAAQAADEARAAARRTAEVCGIPADQFLGG
jgi:TolA-binding protein